MGNNPAKGQPAKPDMMEALMSMKMKGKQFERESGKCDKEKDKYIAKAKESLRKGNEEGARLFLELAEQKKQEGFNYLKMSARLEHLAASIKSKTNSVQMVGELDRFTPLLLQQAESMPVEQMYAQLQNFGSAYDNLTVKGKMMDETIDNTLGEKGSTQKVDQMLNELKADIQLDMGMAAPRTNSKEGDVWWGTKRANKERGDEGGATEVDSKRRFFRSAEELVMGEYGSSMRGWGQSGRQGFGPAGKQRKERTV